MKKDKVVISIYLFLIIIPLSIAILLDKLTINFENSVSNSMQRAIISSLFILAILGCISLIVRYRKTGQGDMMRYIVLGGLAVFLLFYLMSLYSLSNFGF